MDKLDATKETKPVELTPDELETVTAGKNTSGQIYLVFKFKLVAVKTISWSH